MSEDDEKGPFGDPLLGSQCRAPFLILASLLKQWVWLIFHSLKHFFLLYCYWKQKWTALVTCHLNKRWFIPFNQLLWRECWMCHSWLPSQGPGRLPGLQRNPFLSPLPSCLEEESPLGCSQQRTTNHRQGAAAAAALRPPPPASREWSQIMTFAE